MGNGVFKALTFSDFSTSDDIKLVCQKMFSALPTSGVCYRVRMKPTPSGTTADAYVYCASSNYGFVHFRDHGGTDYYGRVQNGTWTWDSYALKSDLYPSYNRSILFSNLKADVTDQSITITEDGMVQAVAKTQAIVGTAFVRFVVNNTVVYEGHTVSGTYRYLWTPIFPVKKGDVIKVTLETGTSDGQRFVYFYKS